MVSNIMDEGSPGSVVGPLGLTQENWKAVDSNNASAADNVSHLCDGQSVRSRDKNNSSDGTHGSLRSRSCLWGIVCVGLPLVTVSLGLVTAWMKQTQRASNQERDERENRNLRGYFGRTGSDGEQHTAFMYAIAALLCAAVVLALIGCTYCRQSSERNASEWRQKHKGSFAKKVSTDKRKLKKYNLNQPNQTGSSKRMRQNPVHAAAVPEGNHRSQRVKELSNSPFYAGRASIHGGKKGMANAALTRTREIQSNRGIKEDDTSAAARIKSRRASNSVPVKQKRYSQSQVSAGLAFSGQGDRSNEGAKANSRRSIASIPGQKLADHLHTMQHPKHVPAPPPPTSTAQLVDDTRDGTQEQGLKNAAAVIPHDGEAIPTKQEESNEGESLAASCTSYPSSVDSEMSTTTDNTYQDRETGDGMRYSKINGSQNIDAAPKHSGTAMPSAELPSKTMGISNMTDDGGNKVEGTNEDELTPPEVPETDSWKAAFGHTMPRTSRRKKFGSDNPLVEQQRKLQEQKEAREKKKISSRLQQQMEKFEGARAPSRPPPQAPNRGHSTPSKTATTKKPTAPTTPQRNARGASSPTTPGGVAANSSFNFFLQAKGTAPTVGRGRGGGRGRAPTTPR